MLDGTEVPAGRADVMMLLPVKASVCAFFLVKIFAFRGEMHLSAESDATPP
jgi:hypothetical protein